MNREFFLQEMHEYLDKAYEEYNEYQDILKETFREVHRVCEKNKITYYLAWGSLLGYMRDGDEVIPWDYDFDINVPFSEVGKLLNALENDLSDEFYYVSNFNTSKYPFYQIRVTKRGFDSRISHVDIFYMLDAPANAEEQRKMQKQIKKLFTIRAWKYELDNKSNNRIKNFAIRTFQFGISITHPAFLLDLQFKRLCKKHADKACNYYVVLAEGAEIFSYDIFIPCQEVSLGYTKALIPNKAEEFLTIRYGDYARYLSIRDRFDEFYCGYKFIKKYSE